MSEFELKENEGFIYIGGYIHKYGLEMPLKEKKIGKTKSLLDIPDIDDYAYSIDFAILDFYMVEDLNEIHEALLAILDHDRMDGDWFFDDDNDLASRVEKFMTAMGYAKVEDKDGDGIPDHLQ